ncbi:MAG: RagB/SusD family nutrient uptake outer membrane protein [Cyclobacteriaceae bacterium]
MKLKKIFIIFIALGILAACNEEKILEEIPVDFASPNNFYKTMADYDLAVNGMLSQAREVLSADENVILDLQYGTDIGVNNTPNLSAWYGSYPLVLNSNADFVLWHWQKYYKLISSVNTAINRLETSSLTEAEKNLVEAKARFFRGLAYKNLAHLYGGVPIELEEVSSPKTDYTRASRNEVYQQAASDLDFAANNLPAIDQVQDWQVNNLAAYHLLSEVYISLQQWDDAIQAATVVIDNPNTALMTQRFGTRSSEPGDVYWDLFRQGNQNRSAGNTEAIMVWQYEVDVPGGVQSSTDNAGPRLERNWAPFVGQIRYNDPSGISPIISPASDYTGGRGIGRLKPTRHYSHGVWLDDWDDMRNSEYNWVRDLTFNNPNSEWYGQKLSDHPTWFPRIVNDTTRWWYHFPSKVTTPGQHPDGLFLNKDILLLSNSAGTTYTDQYFIS